VTIKSWPTRDNKMSFTYVTPFCRLTTKLGRAGTLRALDMGFLPKYKSPRRGKKSPGGFIFSTFWKAFLMTHSRRLGLRIALDRNNEHDRDPFLLIPQCEPKLNHFPIVSRFLGIPFGCCGLNNRIQGESDDRTRISTIRYFKRNSSRPGALKQSSSTI